MNRTTLKVSLLSAACFALTATQGFAQNSGRLSVKVPFDFTVGAVTLPAGEYNFQEDPSGIVFISSPDAHKSMIVLTNSQGAGRDLVQPIVKFDKVEGGYTLTEIDMLGEPGRRVVTSQSISERPASMSSRVGIGGSSPKNLKK